MSIDETIEEWQSKNRRMGCVAASDWFCSRVSGFKPLRLDRLTEGGELFQHVVATNGKIIIDLAPYADHPKE